MHLNLYLQTLILLILSSTIPIGRCKYIQREDGVYQYQKGEETYNVLATKFSDTLPFEYFDAVINGIDVKKSKENGKHCFTAFYQLMDSFQIVTQNYTESQQHYYTDRVFDAINNASWALSYPGADFVSNCTNMTVQSVESGVYFKKMYTELVQNSTWGQQLEVFLLHIASNALEYKIISMQMHNAEINGDEPLVLQYVIKLIWESVWVTNVYYSELEFYQQQVLIQSEIDVDEGPLVMAARTQDTNNHIKVQSTSKIPESYDFYSYSFYLAVLNRYSDYFDFFSDTQKCNKNIEQLEEIIVNFTENISTQHTHQNMTWQNFTVSQSLIFSNGTRLLHNISQSCLMSADTEVLWDSLVPFLLHQDRMYIIRSWLDSARTIFDDTVYITYLMDDIRVVQGSWTQWILQTFLKGFEAEGMQGTFWGQQIAGINYRKFGFYVGDILGRTTLDNY